MLKPPITAQMALTTLQNLSKKLESKSWIDILPEEDLELLKDVNLVSSGLVAQVTSWNDVHHQMGEMFKDVIDALNNTLVFHDPTGEDHIK